MRKIDKCVFGQACQEIAILRYTKDNLRTRLLTLVLFGLLARALCAAGPAVLAVDIDGVVHPVTVEIISSAIEQARHDNDTLLIVRLNTPGGLMDAMRESIEKILASPVPVVTYVTPSGGRAASAGFFLLEAGDVAAMEPETNTGAAHPVVMGAEMDPVMKQKLEQDATALLRSICSKRGRNSDLAQTAVLQSKSFTDQEALSNHLIDLVAADERELLAKLDGREVTRFNGTKQTLHVAGAGVAVYEKNIRQKILAAVADPNIALILLVLGVLGIYIEFTSPGLIVPGIIGAILALLGLAALSMLPINWLGAALLVLAMSLFVLEAKFASHGILGIGGAVCMVLGALLLVNSPLPELRIKLATALSLAIPFSLITVLLVSLVVKARSNKVITGSEGMIGEVGVATSEIAPEGKIFVRGEYWNAIADAPIAAGTRVRVKSMEGLRLTVEPV